MFQTAFCPMGRKRNPFIGKTRFGVSKPCCPCRFDIGTLKMPSEPAIRASDGIFPYIHTIRRSVRLSEFC
ncbi:hypothetical protein A6L48_02225 [Neisseria meningitidis]|nr:hypothetical protein A6L49_04300 [Neisseria meningitidis]ANX24556.1 hypothetical protein A6L47_10430 [Neisseria meningitidis]ANX37716.1 hypothetical protein A6L48_02225 [Neisseria meningitidis]ANX51156.1 hypothetical protein A6L46_07645 [Neisseria meningitidis]ANX74493.1 hypothetical protein A6L42_10685 [Neisseria meningitidis]